MMFVRKENQQKAIELVLEVVRQCPNAPEAYKTLATMYEEIGDKETAIKMLLIGKAIYFFFLYIMLSKIVVHSIELIKGFVSQLMYFSATDDNSTTTTAYCRGNATPIIM